MRRILLAIFKILHIIFFTFVILGPFTNSNYILLLHSMFIPFLLVHWVFNDNTCAITRLKNYKKINKKEKYDKERDCLTCKLINPVFDFRKNNMSQSFIYTVTIVLWIITIISLKKKIDQVK